MTKHKRPYGKFAMLFAALAAALLFGLVACSAEEAPAPAPAPTIDTAAISSAIESAVSSAVATAVENAVADAVAQAAAAGGSDQMSPQEIQSMVEAAVKAATPESASPEDIRAMVESAVEASVTPGATREEIQSLVSKAVADSAAASQPGVTAAEVEKLVQEAVMGASESAAMAASEAAQKAASEAASMAATEAAAAASKAVEAAAMERADGEEKVLKISTNAAPPNFNPLIAVSRTQGWVFNHIYSSLTMADPEGQKMSPDLAERWDTAMDGSSVTFHLRKNAQWHDGTPVTAHDVAWSYHMYLNGETGSKRTGVLALIKGGEAYTKGEAESVEGIVVEDDYTIRFEQEFPNILFLQQTTYPILPKHVLGDVPPSELANEKFFFDSPMGSGPFKFVSYIPDQRIEFEANPEYYFGRPNIDREILSIIKSPDAVQIALQRGEIHMPIFDGGENASTEQFQAFIQDPRFTVAASRGTTLISYAFNSRREHLNNDAMRQAFLHALDRQKLVDTFAQGNGLIYNSFLVHDWYQLPDWSQKYPYDPDKARQLIAESGWDTNTEIGVTIITVTSEEARAMLAAEQQMLAEVGIKIKFHEVELSLWVETFYETYDWDMIRVTFGVFPDPDGFLSFHLRSGSRNAMGYSNPTLDEKIDRGKRSIDVEERAMIYQEINEEMLTELPLAPVHLLNQWWIIDKKFSIPFFDMLPEAKSFATVPIGPAYLGHSDWQKYHIEQWDLN